MSLTGEKLSVFKSCNPDLPNAFLKGKMEGREKAVPVRTWSMSTSSPSEASEAPLPALVQPSTSVLPPLKQPISERWIQQEEDSTRPSGCRYVWTASALTWLLPLLVSGCLLVASFLSSNWLVGPGGSETQSAVQSACRLENVSADSPMLRTNAVSANVTRTLMVKVRGRESIGLAGGCHADKQGRVQCLMFPGHSSYLSQSPPVWRLAVVCFAVAGLIIITCLLLVLIAPAKPDCVCTSLFGLAGLLQGFSGEPLCRPLSLSLSWSTLSLALSICLSLSV